eukprot:scaffold35029_cov54-Phaeocystis_antarctica.AAC.6
MLTPCSSDTGATSAASFRRPRSALLPAGATRWTRPGLPDGLAPCRADPGHARLPPVPVCRSTLLPLVTRIATSCGGQRKHAPCRLNFTVDACFILVLIHDSLSRGAVYFTTRLVSVSV